MDPETWNRLQTLFGELVDLPGERREHRLRDPALDPTVVRGVRELLDEHESGRPLALEGRLVEATPAGYQPGLELGPYRLIEPLGRGGMGEVWLAERDEGGFSRKVAIKRIRRGLVSAEALRRFHRERQLLARLAHRSIARLLDAGVDAEAVPYVVLEYVDGRPITEACDAQRLPVAKRLALFEEVCGAVAYAHAHLVVHRDLKPSNILLTAAGEIRLLDFGIAKLLEGEGHAGEDATRTRGLLVTPEYASPEQLAGGAVTTATDVFALGALLHELLVGQRPFVRWEEHDLELARAIVELDAPAPSVVAAQGPEGLRAARAAARASTPRELVRQLRGDLDTVVAMALRKEPSRRYASVERLAEDIARHRAGHTVRARPDSARYRTAKFFGRHRVPALAASAAVLALATLATQVVRQSSIAAHERDLARAERDAAREVTEVLVSLFEADPYASGDSARDQLSLGDFLVASEATVRRELEDRPQLRSRLFTLLARLNANLGLLDPALALAQEAVDERRRNLGPDQLDLAESLNILGTALQERGDYDRAELVFREALAIRERTLGEVDEDTAESVNNLAVLLAIRARPEDLGETEQLERRGLALRRQVFGDHHLDTAQSLNNLAVFLYQQRRPGDLEAAAQLLGEALAIREGDLGADHPWVANTRSNLANVLLLTARADEAEPLFREAIRGWSASLGPEHARVASGWWGLSKALERRGDLRGAIDAARRTAAIETASLPADHPNVSRGYERITALEAQLAAKPAGADP